MWFRISKEEGLKKSKEVDMSFFEISATNNINITKMIDNMVNLPIKNLEIK